MSHYVNQNIASTNRVFPMQGRAKYARFDMNENPAGLPKDFVDSILGEITPEFLATYPEPGRFEQKYAGYLGCDAINVMTTNGSDMAIRYLLETFGEPGKDVVTVNPSFEMYRINCSLLGLRHVPVPYESDLSFDIAKLLEAIGPDTRVVALLNPNNPVGNVFARSEIEEVVARAAKVGAMVIIDEAYHYFCPVTYLDLALSHDNVVVLRTFSKLFSLAACRLGMIVGTEETISQVRRARLSFDVNSIALLFAERLIDNPDIIEELIRTYREGKAHTYEVLASWGYEPIDCAGNFFLLKPRGNASEIAKKLMDEHVLVHAFGSSPLDGFIRVSTGDAHSMDVFLECFHRIDA